MKIFYHFTDGDNPGICVNKKLCKNWHNIGRIVAKYKFLDEYPKDNKTLDELTILTLRNSTKIETIYLKYDRYDREENEAIYNISYSPKEGYTPFWYLPKDFIYQVEKKLEELKAI